MPKAEKGFSCPHLPHVFPAEAWRRARARAAESATSSSQPSARVASRTRFSGVIGGVLSATGAGGVLAI
jgi:hypothetical protein